MLRKSIPGDVDFSIERAAARLAGTFLKLPGLQRAHLCFDTPAFHHPMRDIVALKRSPRASPSEIAALKDGKLPGKVLVDGRLYSAGNEPYEEIDAWTTATQVCINRAMASSRGKARYMLLLQVCPSNERRPLCGSC